MADFRKDYEEFENLVRELMHANGFIIEDPFIETVSGDFKYDFVARREDSLLAVEVKFYRTIQAQRDLLLVAATHLARIQDPRLTGRLLIVSAIVPDSLRQTLQEHGVSVVDASNLGSWASVNPALADRLDSTLESKSIAIAPKSVVIEAKTSTATANMPSPAIVATPNVGANFCAELLSIGCGKQHWNEYEDLCERILKYLFSTDLHGWYQQQWIDGGLARYDLICRVTAMTKLWALVYNHLSSQYVVFEFKNYCKPITQNQILTTEKYLHERALRRVAFILTRKGEDSNAKKVRQGAIRDAGKLMLVLTDEDLCKMLLMRDFGDDASDHLFDLADEFLISLPR
jgi:hypothetical protein